MKSFKTLLNYESANKTIAILAGAICLAAIAALVFQSIHFSNELKLIQHQIYVMDKSSGITMKASTEVFGTEHRDAQYRAAMREQFKLLCEFDENTYRSNLDKALIRLGESGKQIELEYENLDILTEMQRLNLIYTVDVKNAYVSRNNGETFGEVIAHQTITSPAGKYHRFMNARFKIYDTQVSDDNPLGVKFDDWEWTDTREITKEMRKQMRIDEVKAKRNDQ